MQRPCFSLSCFVLPPCPCHRTPIPSTVPCVSPWLPSPRVATPLRHLLQSPLPNPPFCAPPCAVSSHDRLYCCRDSSTPPSAYAIHPRAIHYDHPRPSRLQQRLVSVASGGGSRDSQLFVVAAAEYPGPPQLSSAAPHSTAAPASLACSLCSPQSRNSCRGGCSCHPTACGPPQESMLTPKYAPIT